MLHYKVFPAAWPACLCPRAIAFAITFRDNSVLLHDVSHQGL